MKRSPYPKHLDESEPLARSTRYLGEQVAIRYGSGLAGSGVASLGSDSAGPHPGQFEIVSLVFADGTYVRADLPNHPHSWRDWSDEKLEEQLPNCYIFDR